VTIIFPPELASCRHPIAAEEARIDRGAFNIRALYNLVHSHAPHAATGVELVLALVVVLTGLCGLLMRRRGIICFVHPKNSVEKQPRGSPIPRSVHYWQFNGP
jgi:hypothetical protein